MAKPAKNLPASMLGEIFKSKNLNRSFLCLYLLDKSDTYADLQIFKVRKNGSANSKL
jgi:hypothetical protein